MAFISEIHYLNAYAASSGVTEYVEVSLTAADFARAADFIVATYQLDGSVDGFASLDTLPYVFDLTTGLYVFTFERATSDPDSSGAGGEAEAIALVDTGPGGGILSFYDIGGGTTGITAVDGPASGATSTNIAGTAANQSIQFNKDGDRLDGPLTPGAAVCFASGTLIDTPEGPRPVEDLHEGDLVVTRDHGPQPVVWHGRQWFSASDLRARPNLCPVRIPAGAISDGLPRRDLVVSPQHRVLLSGGWVELMTGEAECLVPAAHLARADTRVAQELPADGVTYHHLLLGRHEIIYAEGQESESFHVGAGALTALGSPQLAELDAIFPGLAAGRLPGMPLCAPSMRHWEASALAARRAEGERRQMAVTV
jgi:hypothetical protein